MLKKLKKSLQNALPKIVGGGLNLIGLFSPKAGARLAVYLFTKPRGGSYKPHQEKYIASFQHKDLKLGLDTISTYYKDNSAQHTILLVHGWESNASRWRKLVKYLATLPYNIALMDGPAHGHTGSDYFTAILYADMINEVYKEYKPTVIIGHSIGGFASAVSVSKYNIPLRKLVILAAPNKMIDLFEIYYDVIGLSKRVTQMMNHVIKERFGHPMEYYAVSNYIEKRKDMPEGLLIHDQDDKINPYYNALQIVDSWDNCKFITTKGLGHGLQSTEVFEHVKSFLS